MRPLPSPCAWFSSYARLSLPEHACLSAIEPRLPYLNGKPLKKKRPARRGLAGHGGDSEAALVRGGGSPARYGDAHDRRGLAIRRCELPRICYRLSTLHLFRRMSASRKQLTKRPRLKLGFG